MSLDVGSWSAICGRNSPNVNAPLNRNSKMQSKNKIIYATRLIFIFFIVIGFYSCSKKSADQADIPHTGEIDEMELAKEAPAILRLPTYGAPDRDSDVSVVKKKHTIETWKRSRVTANTSRLMIGETEELPLKAVQANILIEGFRARVVIDTFYFNDTDKQYEGTFKLRLPEGANPYFFAFGEMVLTADIDFKSPIFMDQKAAAKMGVTPDDIMKARKDSWTAPREARMVPREKAAYAYHETVRKQIDPALMEWSGAGIFTSRVFPLLPKKLHRIVIGYEVDLLPVGNNLEYRFDLPVNIPQRVIDLSVTKLSNTLIQTSPETTFINNGPRQFTRFENPEAHSIIVKIKEPGTILLSGRDPETGEYSTISLKPDLPRNQNDGECETGIFLVDVSLSSNPDRFHIYLKLMEAILNNNRDSLKQFAVLFFNIEGFWWKEKFCRNTTANVKELMSFSNTLSLEGATDIGAALNLSGNPAWRDNADKKTNWDLFLLSDGAATWGENDLFALSEKITKSRASALFAYRTGIAGTDFRSLTHLSREAGGTVFSITGEAEISAASIAHRNAPWHIDRISVSGMDDIILSGRPVSLFPGQSILMAGRGTPAPSSLVSMVLSQNGIKQTVTTRIDHTLKSPLAKRAYGLIATGQLEAFRPASGEIAQAYGTHFRVTGKSVSLLMLESEEEYNNYNIKPEENAFLIKETPVVPYIANLLETMGDTLGNPKKSFISWLTKMEKMPGITFRIPAAFKLALQSIPEESFQVRATPLSPQKRTWRTIPEKIQTSLKTKDLSYDDINEEALRRYGAYGAHDALRAISSLVENSPGDYVLGRDIAYSASNWELPGHAYHLLNRVARARPYEPQTYRAMARVLEKAGLTDLALIYYEIGLMGQWDTRYGEFTRIHGLDYLRFLNKITEGDLHTTISDFASARLKTISKEFHPGKVDLLVTVTWNTDGTDVDLHVEEPSGETCYYQNKTTKSGGELTLDVTQGYGPEMYILKKAAPGKYKIKVKYFSSNTNRASARTKVSATIIEYWGTKKERVTNKTITLKTGKEMHDIVTIKI